MRNIEVGAIVKVESSIGIEDVPGLIPRGVSLNVISLHGDYLSVKECTYVRFHKRFASLFEKDHFLDAASYIFGIDIAKKPRSMII